MTYKGVDIAKRKLVAKMSKLARQALSDPKLANRLKNKITLGIKKNSILPSGQPVGAISQKWNQRREQLSSINKTSQYYGYGKSNMTFTGQFLNSFKGEIKRFGTSVRLIVYPTGIHKGYSLVYGEKSDSVFNYEIARGFIDRGDDYRVIGLGVRKELAKSAKARILKEFKLNL